MRGTRGGPPAARAAFVPLKDMQHGGGAADRFRRLVRERIAPGMAHLGFDQRPPGVLAGADSGEGVQWLVDLEIAPWTTPSRICFTVAWGVTVPGIDAVLDDPEPVRNDVRACAVHGMLGQVDRKLDPTWFELKPRPWPLPSLLDPSLAQRVLGAVHRDVVPRLQLFTSPSDVQAHLYDRLEHSRGVPTAEELSTIRRIAALSLLLGERENALRWIEHLAARLEAAMAPDLAAERVEPLRRLCLAS